MEDQTKSNIISESKVPEVTLGFWIIKIAATTLGETGGDTVTMTLNWGYLAGTCLFLAAMIVLVAAQVRARKFNPALYWATIVASTTFGTTMADFADRSLGIGYTGGSTLLLTCLVLVLGLWYRAEGTISVNSVSTPRVEAFYWGAITFSQTLGTALGDWIADTGDMGYRGGALIFAAGLVVIAALYFWTRVSRVTLFWTAFILTRPLGATVGDFLDKPLDHGGLALSRPLASVVIAAFMLVVPAADPATRGAASRRRPGAGASLNGRTLADDRRQRRVALVRLGLARRKLREGLADADRRRRIAGEAEFLRPRRVEAGAVIGVVETRLADAEQCVADEQERVDSRNRRDDLPENRHVDAPTFCRQDARRFQSGGLRQHGLLVRRVCRR